MKNPLDAIETKIHNLISGIELKFNDEFLIQFNDKKKEKVEEEGSIEIKEGPTEEKDNPTFKYHSSRIFKIVGFKDDRVLVKEKNIYTNKYQKAILPITLHYIKSNLIEIDKKIDWDNVLLILKPIKELNKIIEASLENKLTPIPEEVVKKDYITIKQKLLNIYKMENSNFKDIEINTDKECTEFHKQLHSLCTVKTIEKDGKEHNILLNGEGVELDIDINGLKQ